MGTPCGNQKVSRRLAAILAAADAIPVLERTSREHWEHYLWLAACYAAVNEEAAALQAGQAATNLRPRLSIGSYVDWRFKWKRAEDESRLRSALARAGLAP